MPLIGQAGHHRHIHKDIEEQHHRHADASQLCEPASDTVAEAEHRSDQQQIEPEDKQIADKAELLADHGEDEVGLLFGKIIPVLIWETLKEIIFCVLRP